MGKDRTPRKPDDPKPPHGGRRPGKDFSKPMTNVCKECGYYDSHSPTCPRGK